MNARLDSRRGLELHAAAIDRLPTNLKGALAAACTQRQAEVYRAYARRTGDASAEDFDDLLNAIWDDISFPQASEHERKRREDQADGMFPSTKTKRDLYKAGAEQAILSLLYSNGVLMNGKTQEVIHAAHQAFGSIDHFLTSPLGQKPRFDPDDPDSYAKVLAHPLTEAEHRRQERDLSEIEQALLAPNTIPGAVDRLRKRAEIEARIFLSAIDSPAA